MFWYLAIYKWIYNIYKTDSRYTAIWFWTVNIPTINIRADTQTVKWVKLYKNFTFKYLTIMTKET